MAVPGEVLARDFLKLEARKQQIEVLTWQFAEEVQCRHTVAKVQRAASLTQLDRRFKLEEGDRVRTLERNQLLREQASLYQRQVGAQIKLRGEPSSVRSEVMEKIRDSRELFTGQVERMTGEWHKLVEDQMKNDIKKAQEDTSHCLHRQNELLHAARRQEQLLEELLAERQRMQEERTKVYSLEKELADRNQELRERLEQEREVNEKSVLGSLGVVPKKDDLVERGENVTERSASVPAPPTRSSRDEPLPDRSNISNIDVRTPSKTVPRVQAETETKAYVPRQGTRQYEVYQRLKSYEMEMESDLRLLEGMPSLYLPKELPKMGSQNSVTQSCFESEARAPVVYVPVMAGLHQPPHNDSRGNSQEGTPASNSVRRAVVEQSPPRALSRLDRQVAEVHDLHEIDHAPIEMRRPAITGPANCESDLGGPFQQLIEIDRPRIEQMPNQPQTHSAKLSAPDFDLHAPIPSISEMENQLGKRDFEVHAPMPAISEMENQSGKLSSSNAWRPGLENTLGGSLGDTFLDGRSPANAIAKKEANFEVPGNASTLQSIDTITNAGQTAVTQPHWPYGGSKPADPLQHADSKNEKRQNLQDRPVHAELPPVTPFSPSHSVDLGGSGEFHISSSGEPNMDNWIPADVTTRFNQRNPGHKGVDPRMDASLQSSMSFSPGELHRDLSQAAEPQEQTPSFLRPGIESSLGEVRNSVYGADSLSFSRSATNTVEGSFARGVFETNPELPVMAAEATSSNPPILSNADLMKGFRKDVQVRAEDLRSTPRDGQTSGRSSMGGDSAYFQKMEPSLFGGSQGNRDPKSSMLTNSAPKFESSEQRRFGGSSEPRYLQKQAESPLSTDRSTDRRQEEIISAIAQTEMKTTELPKEAPKRTPWGFGGSFSVKPGKDLDDDEIDGSDDDDLNVKGALPFRGGRLGIAKTDSSRTQDSGKEEQALTANRLSAITVSNLTSAARAMPDGMKDAPVEASRRNFNSFDLGTVSDDLSEPEDVLRKSSDLPSDDGYSLPKAAPKKKNPLSLGTGRNETKTQMGRSASQTSDEFGFGRSSADSNTPVGAAKSYGASFGKSSALSSVKSRLNNQRSGTSSFLGLPIDWSQADSHK